MPTLVHTADGKYVLAAAGVHVKLFSCETGALVRLLSGHSAAVTAVDRADDNVLQAVSASLDGCIVVWGLDDAVALRVVGGLAGGRGRSGCAACGRVASAADSRGQVA